MRVPTDSTNPSFDHTFKVGFFRWLRSSKADRAEWQRRRDLAAQAAREGQNTRIDDWAARKRDERS